MRAFYRNIGKILRPQSLQERDFFHEITHERIQAQGCSLNIQHCYFRFFVFVIILFKTVFIGRSNRISLFFSLVGVPLVP